MTTTDQDLRRIGAAKNQSIFRDVNERIEQINESFDLSEETLDFVCECAHETCHERLALTHAARHNAPARRSGSRSSDVCLDRSREARNSLQPMA